MWPQGRRYKKLFWLSAISPLLSVILSTAAVYATRADKHGVKIIQRVQAGLNPSSASQLRLSGPYTVECAKTAIICAVIALTVINKLNSSVTIRAFYGPVHGLGWAGPEKALAQNISPKSRRILGLRWAFWPMNRSFVMQVQRKVKR